MDTLERLLMTRSSVTFNEALEKVRFCAGANAFEGSDFLKREFVDWFANSRPQLPLVLVVVLKSSFVAAVAPMPKFVVEVVPMPKLVVAVAVVVVELCKLSAFRLQMNPTCPGTGSGLELVGVVMSVIFGDLLELPESRISLCSSIKRLASSEVGNFLYLALGNPLTCALQSSL